MLVLTPSVDFALLCNGDTDGTGTFTASGGTAPYIFTVDVNTTGGTTSTTAATLDFAGAGVGSITVTVTDASGCTQQATINVTEPAALTLNTTGDILLTCNGDTNGAGSFAAGGGTPGYTFVVDTNTTGAATSTTATTLDFTGAGIGTITVTVTDANGCSTQSTINVTEPPLPTTADAGPDKTVCGPTNLEGNTPAIGTGTWTIIAGAGGALANANNPTSGFSGTAGVTYTLRWSIANGPCTPSTDNVDITFDINTPTTADAGPDQDLCAASTVLAGNTPLIGVGAWSIVSGAGGTIVDPADPVSAFNGVQGTTYVLQWTIDSGGGCATSIDQVTIVLGADPTIADAGADQSVCSPSTNLAGNIPVVGTGLWSIVSGVGGAITDTADPASAFSGAAGTTYVLRWTISSGSCTPSEDDVQIIFEVAPTTANAGPDQLNICGAATLAANTPLVGTGTWTIMSGAGGVLVDPTDPATSFSGTAGTTYTLRWTITNGSCPPSIDEVDISFDSNTPTASNAGPDQQICGTSTVLGANNPVVGTGSWSIVSGAGGSVGNTFDPNSNFGGTAGETYLLRWVITSVCGSSADTVMIVFDENPTIADAGVDASICGPVVLSANVPTVGTGQWTIITGAGGLLADPNDPNSLFSGVGGTTYTLRWTITNGTCPASTDEVDVAFDVNTPTTADAGPDQAVCATFTTLAANTAVVGVGQWTILSGVGGSFVDDTSPTTDFNGAAGETYVLRWEISNGALCTPSNDDVTIVFDIAPSVADAGADQTQCTTTVTLAGNTPVSGTGTWSVISGLGGSFVDPANPTTDFTGTSGVTYVLQWAISNACGSSTDDATISFDALPTTADAGPDKNVCGPTTMDGNTPVVGTGTWTIIAGAGGVLADPNDPASTFSGVGGTTYTLRWTIDNGSCPSSFDEVDISFDINYPNHCVMRDRINQFSATTATLAA
ncbi:MAG: hypothetical protein HC859_08005, partial [Bacteroidia bacterium]|nr:hypothetical protein [Bacteroidia bacterium]